MHLQILASMCILQFQTCYIITLSCSFKFYYKKSGAFSNKKLLLNYTWKLIFLKIVTPLGLAGNACLHPVLVCSSSLPAAEVTESKKTSPGLCIPLAGAPACGTGPKPPIPHRPGQEEGRRRQRSTGQHGRTKPPSGNCAYVGKSVTLAGGCNSARL